MFISYWWRWIVAATLFDVKSILNTISIVLERYSVFQNVCQHLVYNVFEFHKPCFSGLEIWGSFHHYYFSWHNPIFTVKLLVPNRSAFLFDWGTNFCHYAALLPMITHLSVTPTKINVFQTSRFLPQIEEYRAFLRNMKLMQYFKF